MRKMPIGVAMVGTFILVVAACIPLGICLAFYTGNNAWLILSAIAIIFFYAGEG